MKKFRFPLEQVMEVREIKKKDCQRQLAKSVEELHQAEKKLQEAQENSHSSNEKLRQALQQSAHAGILTSLDRWRRRQEGEMLAQDQRTHQHREQVDHRRAALLLAAKEKRILERLRERRLEEHRDECLKEEQSFLDELGCRIGRTVSPLRGADLEERILPE